MYETANAHPQRVGGWGLFQLDDDAIVIARDPRRIIIRAQPEAGLTPQAVRDLFDLLDGSRSVDGVVDAIHVPNSGAVEFGQTLVTIVPAAG